MPKIIFLQIFEKTWLIVASTKGKLFFPTELFWQSKIVVVDVTFPSYFCIIFIYCLTGFWTEYAWDIFRWTLAINLSITSYQNEGSKYLILNCCHLNGSDVNSYRKLPLPKREVNTYIKLPPRRGNKCLCLFTITEMCELIHFIKLPLFDMESQHIS